MSVGVILGGWDIILRRWEWVGKYFGWVGVGALFDNAFKLTVLCLVVTKRSQIIKPAAEYCRFV